MAPYLRHFLVERNLNKTAPVQMPGIRGLFRKSTLKCVKKQQFIPLFCQSGHARLDVAR